MTELTCICCPMGCRLTVDEDNDYAVTGNTCKRGAVYGRNELMNPTRVLTTTVAIDGAAHGRMPVRTADAIPKGKLFDAIEELKKVHLTSPVHCGDVVHENLLGTGINVIASRDL